MKRTKGVGKEVACRAGGTKWCVGREHALDAAWVEFNGPDGCVKRRISGGGSMGGEEEGERCHCYDGD